MSSARQSTFFWHDYETFGADPARDRPVQFAGVRTDTELQPVGDPLVLYCRPADDFLPQPRACLITGITPQLALEKGVPECQFISRIHAEMAQPGTCTVGYNSLRFDDEVTRHTLYRNFFDPYAREWQNGNSRWDIIDMLRTACALRPEGIEWPLRDDGLPSFRLEELTAANGIGHAGAHDALADVRATIALAALVRERQPKLYDYLLDHRDKRSVLAQFDIENMKPVLHVSGMFGAQRHCIALIVPLAIHPVNRNEVICYDLDAEPGALLELSADALRERLYTRSEDLAEDCQRPGLKSVHINRCPVIIPAGMATPAIAERLGIEGERCRRHLAMLREYRQADAQGFRQKIADIYQPRERPAVTDPDLALYSGGFFADQDKRCMDAIRAASPEELAEHSWVFSDQRLPEMLFRYRARNYPESLSGAERAQWEEYRFQRLTDPEAGASICMDAFHVEIEALQADSSLPPAARRILEQLLDYSDALLA
ncbi:MAG: exodeoxyribonuclease I [Halioglobus sp.]